MANIPPTLSQENDDGNKNKNGKNDQLEKLNNTNTSRKVSTTKKKIIKTDGQQWDDFLKRKESEFTSHHRKILSKCAENSLWNPIDSGSANSNYENGNKYNGRQSNKNRNEENDNDIDRDIIENENDSSDSMEGSDSSDDDDDDDGFRAHVRGSKATQGWGLYTVNVESDSEEEEVETREIEINDDDDDDENEEECITQKKKDNLILHSLVGGKGNSISKEFKEIEDSQAIPENNDHFRKKKKTIVADQNIGDENLQLVKKSNEKLHGDFNNSDCMDVISNINTTVQLCNSIYDNGDARICTSGNSDNLLPILRKRKKRGGNSVGDSMLSLTQ